MLVYINQSYNFTVFFYYRDKNVAFYMQEFMSFHSDTLSWFWANQFLYLLFNAAHIFVSVIEEHCEIVRLININNVY
jgi:hypothetical protein